MIPGKAGDPGRTGNDNRLFLDAVLWMARTGAPWRDLPGSFGLWNTVWKRFSRWSKKGVWEIVFGVLAQDDPDLEYVSIDGTIVRAHQHSAGGKGGLKSRRLGGREAA
jgi:putative transposase